MGEGQVRRPVRPDVGHPLGFEAAMRVKHLDSRVLAVGDVDNIVAVERNGMRYAKLPFAPAEGAPLAQKGPIVAEYRNPRVAISVSHEDLRCVWADGHICRLVEYVRPLARLARGPET